MGNRDKQNSGDANLGKTVEGPGSVDPGTKMNRELATKVGNSVIRLPSAPKAFRISSSCGKRWVEQTVWDGR